MDVLSPDSSRSLDFDMYLDFSRDGDRIDTERDADSAPILADFKCDSTWQLAFCGTGCSFDGAYWVDRDHCALTGVTLTGEQMDGPPCAFLEVYDLRSAVRTRWLGPKVNDREYSLWQATSDSALVDRVRRAWGTAPDDISTGPRLWMGTNAR